MLSRLLTLFFAFATFAATQACCCPADAKTPVTLSTISEPSLPLQQSCCHVAKLVEPKSQPAEKKLPAKVPGSKCPCMELRGATTLPPLPFNAASLNLDWPISFDFAFPTSVLSAVPATGSHSRKPVPYPVPLSGRDLLAVYSILRC